VLTEAADARLRLSGGMCGLAACGEVGFAVGGVAGLDLSAAFEFGVEFGAEQDHHVGDPEPHKEDHDAGERAVGFVVGTEVGDVEANAAEAMIQTTTARMLPGLTQRILGWRTLGPA